MQPRIHATTAQKMCRPNCHLYSTTQCASILIIIIIQMTTTIFNNYHQPFSHALSIPTSSIKVWGSNANGALLGASSAPISHFSDLTRVINIENILWNATLSWTAAGFNPNEYSDEVVQLQSIFGTESSGNLNIHVNYVSNSSGIITRSRVFTCGYFSNAFSLPPPMLSIPTPLSNLYSLNDTITNEFLSKTLQHMYCERSCLAVTTDQLVYVKFYNFDRWQLVTGLPSNTSFRQVHIAFQIPFVYPTMTQETFFILTQTTGEIYSFGYWNSGIRGTGNSDLLYHSVAKIDSISNITFITSASLTMLALNSTGFIYGWGSNANALLLDNNLGIQTSIPVCLPFNYTNNVFSQIACGEKHCLALAQTSPLGDTKVFGFGDNGEHQIDSSSEKIKYSPTDITKEIFGGSCQVMQIYATFRTSGAFCLLGGGIVSIWGRDLSTSQGWNPNPTGPHLLNFPYQEGPAILSKAYFVGETVVAFGSMNQVYVLGDNTFGQTCVGDLKFSQFPLEVPLPSESQIVSHQSNVQQLFTISGASLAFSKSPMSDDKFEILAWGKGSHINLMPYSNAINPTVILNHNYPYLFTENMTSLNIYYDCAVMLTSDGSYYAWGDTLNNRLGIGHVERYLDTPTKVTYLQNLTSVATGNSHTLVIDSDGVVYGVGSNSFGQFCLGAYDTGIEDHFRKTGINDYLGVKIVQVAVGTETSYFLTSTGRVYACGSNSNSILSSSLSDSAFYTPIPIGENSELAGKKVKKMILPIHSTFLFMITQDGVLFRHMGSTDMMTIPNQSTSKEYVIDVAAFREGVLDHFYFVTSLGNIYTMGSDSTFFQISQQPTVKSLAIPTLYATKESLGGVPYLITANSYVQVVALSSGWKCFGINSTDPNVCSGSGICVDVDTCECKSHVLNKDCSLFSCFGILKNETSLVCSGRGQCVSWNQCQCSDGYYGTNCEQYSCLDHKTNSVCSGNGECVGPHVCSCYSGWYGDKCEKKSCFSEGESYGASEKKRLTMKGKLCSKINTYL